MTPNHPRLNTDHTHQSPTNALRHPSPFQCSGLVPGLNGHPDIHLATSGPVPVFSSEHQPLFAHIVIAHAVSLLPDPVFSIHVYTLDPSLSYSHHPDSWH